MVPSQEEAGLTLRQKKKKSSKKKEDGDEDGGEDDFAALKKKKKSSKKKVEDDFEAKLAAAGGEKAEGEEDAAAAEPEVVEGDMIKGTGVWAHDATAHIPYNLLLNRFFTLLHSQHPDLASTGTRSYKIPPPQCLREGNKKTIFANIAEICKRMKRTEEHVTQFLFAELGTSGSVAGERRLVIKGRFQQKQIENVLRRYIVEYVTCKTCRSPDTEYVFKSYRRMHRTNAFLVSPRVRTVSTSLPATAADRGVPSRPSRLVSLLKSESGEGRLVKQLFLHTSRSSWWLWCTFVGVGFPLDAMYFTIGLCARRLVFVTIGSYWVGVRAIIHG
jgi:translation initiation factor 2 beta subunit (eIF-2beta)/eIF-5